MTSAPPPVFILSRSDVQSLMDRERYLEAVELGFRAAYEGKAHSPLPMAVEGSGGTFHAKAASISLDRHYAALKLNGNFPGNPEANGLPTIQGAILLSDGDTGSLLAIMDSIEITLRRTAAATALAARYLARPESKSILMCGCGGQAAAQLEALGDLFSLSQCFAWDKDLTRAKAFATASADGDCSVAATADLAEAAGAADIIVTSTTSRQPFLRPEHVRPGTFIAAVGADSPEKNEIDPALLAQSMVVTDVTEQCAVMGELHHALDGGTIGHADVHAELGELVTGLKTGRTDEHQITLFDSTGTALQDVAAAALIYERARQLPNQRQVLLAT